MGNTKTYYIEGELVHGVTMDQFYQAIYEFFHSTYAVAQIVEPRGGYLGTNKEDGGPFVLAAIHSFSLSGDSGPEQIARKMFKEMRMHRVDSDWADMWVGWWDSGAGGQWQQWHGHPCSCKIEQGS